MAPDNLTFEAYVCHPSLGEDLVWGRIVFEGWKLRFESAQVTREIPLVRLRIERDDSETGAIAFSHPDDTEWVFHTLDESILTHGPLLQQPHTRHQIEALHSGQELKRRLKIVGAFLAGFALVALLVSVAMSFMVRSLVARVPAEWEQKLGDKVMAELKKEETFIQDATLHSNLTWAVAPLMRAVPTNALGYRFYLAESPLPNAFALPGGHVVVTTRLLEIAERPEEVAGVVAHEIAHVTLKHGLRKIISSAGPFLLCQLFLQGGGGLMGVLAGGSQILVFQSFSQEYETEADDVGWDYLVAAHLDPRGLPDMLGKLEREARSMGMVHLAPNALSSHPATEKRIRRLEAKWAKLKDKSGFLQYDQLKP